MLLGDIAPDFQAETTLGPLKFYEWLNGSWCLFFSHPSDFTPVCTTELGVASKMKPQFQERNVKIIGLSVNDLKSHEKWIADINETQNTQVNFPIIADPEKKIATLYRMIHPSASDTKTVRTVFILDPSKKIRMTLTYPASTGRNFQELLRVIDSLQLTDQYKVATPVNWKKGEECIILPSVSDPKALFPKGYRELRPYLRFTPDPSADLKK